MPCGECKWFWAKYPSDRFGLCDFPMPKCTSGHETLVLVEDERDCPQFTPRAQEEK